MKKLFLPITLLLCLAFMLGTFAAASCEEIIAENLDITTYRCVSVGGKLSATGGEGKLKFELCTPPTKGCVDIEEDGQFVYTPGEGKRGKDYFGYRAIDEEGNVSREATVIVRIIKQKTDVCYSDMGIDPAEYAAIYLAEKGIFTGKCLGGSYVFSPDEAVSRQEFLAMCMNAGGARVYTGVKTTGFADDDSISAWAKPYASSALKLGIISGCTDGELGTVFNGDAPISLAEAAVILDRTISLTDAVATWQSYDDAVPAWAVQSVANLSARALIPSGVSTSSESLTRAQAAQMLCSAMELVA